MPSSHFAHILQHMYAPPPPPCIFLDRDGTLIRDKHYLSDPAGVELLPGAVEGLALLQAARCPLVILSNQSGVGRGYFDTACVDRVNARLAALLQAQGVHVTGMLHCPHAPHENCTCRKPAPGMAHEAARRWGLEELLRAGRCVSVGDKMCDVRLAQGLGGCGVLLAPSGKATASGQAVPPAQAHNPALAPAQEKPPPAAQASAHSPEAQGLPPDHISPDLLDAARWIAHHWKLNPGQIPCT